MSKSFKVILAVLLMIGIGAYFLIKELNSSLENSIKLNQKYEKQWDAEFKKTQKINKKAGEFALKFEESSSVKYHDQDIKKSTKKDKKNFESNLINKLKKLKLSNQALTLEQIFKCNALKNVKWKIEKSYRGVKYLTVRFNMCRYYLGVDKEQKIYFTFSNNSVSIYKMEANICIGENFGNFDYVEKTLMPRKVYDFFIKDFIRCDKGALALLDCSKVEKKQKKVEIAKENKEILPKGKKVENIDISSFTAQELNDLSYNYYQKKDYINALKYWRKTVKRYPQFAMGHYNLSCVINILIDRDGCSAMEQYNISKEKAVKHLGESIKYQKDRWSRMQKDNDLTSLKKTYAYQKLLGVNLKKSKNIQKLLTRLDWRVFNKPNNPHFIANIKFNAKITSNKGSFKYQIISSGLSKEKTGIYNGNYTVDKNNITLKISSKEYKGKILLKRTERTSLSEVQLVFKGFETFYNYMEVICED